MNLNQSSIDQSIESSRFFDSFEAFLQSTLASDVLLSSVSPSDFELYSSPVKPQPSPYFQTFEQVDKSAVQPDSIERMSLASRILDADQKINNTVELSPYFYFPQYVAARMLRISPNSLSRKWRKQTKNRKWPYRPLKRLNQEISTLIQNIKLDPSSPDLQAKLNQKIQSRNKEMVPVYLSHT